MLCIIIYNIHPYIKYNAKWTIQYDNEALSTSRLKRCGFSHILSVCLIRNNNFQSHSTNIMKHGANALKIFINKRWYFIHSTNSAVVFPGNENRGHEFPHTKHKFGRWLADFDTCSTIYDLKHL